MFKVVKVQRINDDPISLDNLECSVIAYCQNGEYGDQQTLGDAVDCMNWAKGNSYWASKFEIYNKNWDHRLVGHVGKNKEISWEDVYPE